MFLRRVPDGLDNPEDGTLATLACMIGNGIGHSLGAPLEFSEVRYGSSEVTKAGLCQEGLWSNPEYNAFKLLPGQWTDDFSMALCLAGRVTVGSRASGPP